MLKLQTVVTTAYNVRLIEERSFLREVFEPHPLSLTVQHQRQHQQVHSLDSLQAPSLSSQGLHLLPSTRNHRPIKRFRHTQGGTKTTPTPGNYTAGNVQIFCGAANYHKF